MNIKIIIFNIFLIVFLFSLIYLYIYINYTYEGFYEIEEDTIESNYLNKENTITRINPTMEEIERDGSNPNSAINIRILPYLNFLRTSKKLPPLGDNYYWITIPNIGDRYIYCIMNDNYAGGGWMLAMRGVRGSKTFGYNSKYWTTNDTLNNSFESITKVINNNNNLVNLSISSIGDLIYNNYENNLNGGLNEINRLDAKFDTFNWYPTSEWMAIFYYKRNINDGRPIYYRGGDRFDNLSPENAKGWIWRENNVNIKKNELIPPRALFESRGKIQSTKSLVNLTSKYGVYNAKELDKFKSKPDGYPQLWSSQSAYNFYGINYEIPSHGSSKSYVRWGFAWNENPGNPNDTNDVYAGIGSGYRGGYSCGDFIDCCQDITGVNSSIAFEWYVR